jgi:diamine N-acetyltransferase
MVSLLPIDETNWAIAVDLTVSDEQDGFVSSNAVSLSQAHYEPWWVPLGVYTGDEMVGFVMHGRWPDRPVNAAHSLPTTGNDHIARLMTDKVHQGKGYGRAAMVALIERIRAQGNCRAIEVCFNPENVVAEHLYASLGFVRTGRMIEGEAEMKLDVS